MSSPLNSCSNSDDIPEFQGRDRSDAAHPKKWSNKEDQRLREAIDKFGDTSWRRISEYVKSRDNVQCLQRWQKVLKPGLVKGCWKPSEDNKLRELVTQGFGNWGKVAAHIPGRTSKQCRERWKHHLDPSVRKDSFTPEEDAKLLKLNESWGNRWSAIARMLPGRTETIVRSRFKYLQNAGITDPVEHARRLQDNNDDSDTDDDNTKRDGSCDESSGSSVGSAPSSLSSMSEDQTLRNDLNAASSMEHMTTVEQSPISEKLCIKRQFSVMCESDRSETCIDFDNRKVHFLKACQILASLGLDETFQQTVVDRKISADDKKHFVHSDSKYPYSGTNYYQSNSNSNSMSIINPASILVSMASKSPNFDESI